MNSPEAGQFDLLVESVRLGEDEDFECQVLPGPRAAIKVPLRASVHVNIQGEQLKGRRIDPSKSDLMALDLSQTCPFYLFR